MMVRVKGAMTGAIKSVSDLKDRSNDGRGIKRRNLTFRYFEWMFGQQPFNG